MSLKTLKDGGTRGEFLPSAPLPLEPLIVAPNAE